MRLWHLTTPADYMFDEIYYAKDAKAIVDGRVEPKPPYRWEAGDEVSWPHPEMGKFAIAAGILLFGDRAFGWRVPSVVAGMVLLACVYPLARRLGLPPPWALLALLFAAADPLGITQSRIATLDVFVAAWTVLCIFLALRYVQSGGRRLWLFACGAAGGMALATKWSGALALVAATLVILAGWILMRRALARPRGDVRPHDVEAWAAPQESRGAADVPVPVTAPADAAAPDQSAAQGQAPPSQVAAPAHERMTAPGSPAVRTLHTSGDAVTRVPGSRRLSRRSIARPLALAVVALVLVPAVIYVLSYVQYFAAGHSVADWRELQRQMWVFNLNLEASHTYASSAPTWIVDYRPVWYYFNDAKGMYRGVVAIGNPFLWWLATAALVAAPVLALARRTMLLLPVAVLTALLYLPWFLTSRTSFLYYMTPVAPFLAILLAAALIPLAGGRDLPRRGWMLCAAVAIGTAALWDPIGLALHALGWVSLVIGVAIAILALAVLVLPRLRAARPWLAMALAGAVIGIVVAFIPVVLAVPITPEHFSHITWFPSWI